MKYWKEVVERVGKCPAREYGVRDAEEKREFKEVENDQI